MKNVGDTNILTRQEIRRLKQILTFEDYEKIVRRIITIAVDGENEKNALTAAMYLVDRMEGRIPIATDSSEQGMTIDEFIAKIKQ